MTDTMFSDDQYWMLEEGFGPLAEDDSDERISIVVEARRREWYEAWSTYLYEFNNDQ